MARALRRRALRLLAAAVALASVLACWSLSRRMEQAAVLATRSDNLARAVETAVAALQDSVTRAEFAAQGLRPGCCVRSPAGERPADGADEAAGPPATGLDAVTPGAGAAGPAPSEAVRSGTIPEPGRSGEPDDYWRAEAEATRQLDTLHGLSLRPGLEWLPQTLVDLRDASLAQMAATDDALRRPEAGKNAVPSPGRKEHPDSRMDVLVGKVRSEADDHRRDIVATLLAQTTRDRQRLGAAALIGAALFSALMLAAGRRGSTAPTRLEDGLSPIVEPEASCPDGVEHPVPDAARGLPPLSRPGASPTALSILLVEDNAMVRFSLEMMLADLGHRVSAAANAAEAIQLAEADPDVLVTDLGLPDLDGLALVTHLRARRPELRVVIASGRPGSAAGMVWLQKPFNADQLRCAVEASEAAGASAG